MLTFIAILLYITSVFVFSEYAPKHSTNWSIFYISSIFISYIMICINEISKFNNKFTNLLFYVCIGFFSIMLIQQLSLINTPYDHYYTSVNDSFIDTIRFGFFAIILGVISLKYLIKWVKQHQKF